ncbi:MAG TPA: HD-GYP domain-containing protein [Holophaga sp.]|nr:HD-GYP domain-containing protein [Holophaga sp.]
MIKKIKPEDLRIGMFIHNLNSGWMEHSFLWPRFLLKKEADLQKIRSIGMDELEIDTDKGSDVEPRPMPIVEAAEAPAPSLNPAPAAIHYSTSHLEELATAKRVQNEANEVIQNLLMDIRMGKQLEVEHVEPIVEQITDSILRNQGTLVSLCRIKQRDTYTFQHSVSVATLMISFCRYLGMDRATIQEAGIGAILHDIGKMKVPNAILNKPSKLTDDEFGIMKSHVTLGLEILEQTPGVSDVAIQIVGQHHERFGGSGYPRDLKSNAISQLGRMAAIVDVYDAITSNRVYHTAMEPSVALQKLFEWSKFHFDEELVQQFIQSIGIYPVGSLVRLENDQIAVVIQQGGTGLLHPVVRVIYDIRRKRHIAPQDLDLSQRVGEIQIVAAEDPEDWQINPFDFLAMEQLRA